MTTDTHVIEFMGLYEQLQTATKGEPRRIPFVFKNAPDFADICRRLHTVTFFLQFSTDDAGDTVIENVDPRFIQRWRHYKRDIAQYIDDLVGPEILGDLLDKITKPGEKPATPDEILLDAAQEEGKAIGLRLELGASERLNPSIDEEIADQVVDGEHAIERLFNSIDLKVVDAIYRRMQLDVVHIPISLSNREGDDEIDLITALKEAHRAYIVGLPLATLSLCRTISEILIRDVYGIGDGNTKFTERFRLAMENASARIKGADAELVALVRFASDIMHGKKADQRFLDEINVKALPSDIQTINRVALHWLKKLVRLIESPSSSPVKR